MAAGDGQRRRRPRQAPDRREGARVMAHTPGPFHTGRTAIDMPILVCSGDGRVIARINGLTEEDKDNARLFAAAPETAAERDRLRAEVAELVEALAKEENALDAHRDECGSCRTLLPKINAVLA